MENKTLRLSNGQQIQVYKSKERGTWINSNDCTTEYNDNGNIVHDKNNRPK